MTFILPISKKLYETKHVATWGAGRTGKRDWAHRWFKGHGRQAHFWLSQSPGAYEAAIRFVSATWW
jgi:hypothetical protein